MASANTCDSPEQELLDGLRVSPSSRPTAPKKPDPLHSIITSVRTTNPVLPPNEGKRPVPTPKKPINPHLHRYYVVTWTVFFVCFAFAIAIETVMLVISEIRYPYPCYWYMEPIISKMVEANNALKTTTNTAAKLGYLQILLKGKRESIEIYDEHRKGDYWVFWVNFWLNTACVVFVLAAWVACYVMREKPAIRARGWFFINDYVISTISGLVAMTLFLGNFTGTVGGSVDFLDVETLGTMEAAMASKEAFKVRFLLFGGLMCVTLMFGISCAFKRQRIVGLMFRSHSIRVLGKNEYHKPVPVVLGIGVLAFTGFWMWVFLYDMDLDHMHIMLDFGMMVPALIFPVWGLLYTRGMDGVQVDLRFMDYHNNLRIFLGHAFVTMVAVALGIVYSGHMFAVMLTFSIYRTVVITYLGDAVATIVAYSTILEPSQQGNSAQQSGPKQLSDISTPDYNVAFQSTNRTTRKSKEKTQSDCEMGVSVVAGCHPSQNQPLLD